MKQLKVILLGKEIGILEQDQNGALSFRYHENWVSDKRSRPLSQSLPLRLEKFNEIYDMGKTYLWQATDFPHFYYNPVAVEPLEVA